MVNLRRELRGHKVSQNDPSAFIQKFLVEISHSLVDVLISEIKEALVADNLILEAFNIFNIETESEEYRRKLMNVLYNHYVNQANSIYQGDSTPAEAIISTLDQPSKCVLKVLPVIFQTL